MKSPAKYICLAAAAMMLTGCNIYKKYEMPVADSAIVADYAEALRQTREAVYGGRRRLFIGRCVLFKLG